MITRDIEHEIHLLLIENEVMRKGEILNHFDEKNHRTVGRSLKKLVEKGDIDYGKVRGSKGKWRKYFLKEEKTKDNLLIEAVRGNKKKWKHIRIPVTQRNLSQLITSESKFYRNEELKEWKNVVKTWTGESLHGYISYNIAVIILCLKWISQLTWAINSGMLGNSKTKLALANRNKARYEELLSKVIYNLTMKDERMMKAISKLIYNEIMDTMIFEESTIGSKKIGKKGKGKWFYQFNKKSKYYF